MLLMSAGVVSKLERFRGFCERMLALSRLGILSSSFPKSQISMVDLGMGSSFLAARKDGIMNPKGGRLITLPKDQLGSSQRDDFDDMIITLW